MQTARNISALQAAGAHHAMAGTRGVMEVVQGEMPHPASGNAIAKRNGQITARCDAAGRNLRNQRPQLAFQIGNCRKRLFRVVFHRERRVPPALGDNVTKTEQSIGSRPRIASSRHTIFPQPTEAPTHQAASGRRNTPFAAKTGLYGPRFSRRPNATYPQIFDFFYKLPLTQSAHASI
jgi:hypothetical protein